MTRIVGALALDSTVRLAIWRSRVSLNGMSGWSINLFRVRGIMISLHFTFFLLLAWVAYSGWQEDGVPGLLWSAGFLVAIFICVVLHEFGHAFMAMRFGVRTSRILVTLVGGIALLDSIPRRPIQEFLIAAAGP